MAAAKPIEYRILLVREGEATELARVELPMTVRRDGDVLVNMRAYRRLVRRTLRAIARKF